MARSSPIKPDSLSSRLRKSAQPWPISARKFPNEGFRFVELKTNVYRRLLKGVWRHSRMHTVWSNRLLGVPLHRESRWLWNICHSPARVCCCRGACAPLSESIDCPAGLRARTRAIWRTFQPPNGNRTSSNQSAVSDEKSGYIHLGDRILSRVKWAGPPDHAFSPDIRRDHSGFALALKTWECGSLR